MESQVGLKDEAVAGSEANDTTIEVLPDLAYKRLGIVNVVFFGEKGSDWVLIDAGVFGSTSAIREAVEERFAGKPPAAIIMTHAHFDHVGALEDLVQEWKVPVYAHLLERPHLDGSESYPPADPTVGGGMMAALSRFYPRGPVNVGEYLSDLPQDGTVPFMEGWKWIHTPGHTRGHVALWRESDRTVIAGDAFITTKQESAYAVLTQRPEIHGPPMYYTVDWDSARDSVVRLAALEPEIAITGHGPAARGTEFRRALHILAEEFEERALPKTGKYVRDSA